MRGEGGSGLERTEFNGEGTAMTLRRGTSVWALMAAVLLSGCRVQKVENSEVYLDGQQGYAHLIENQ